MGCPDRAGWRLAVQLRFGGPGADGSPGDEVALELGGNSVEELGPARQAEAIHVEEEFAGLLQPLVDLKAPIEVGVVDEAFPSNRGAGLFEIDAHHHDQLIRVFVGERFQFLCILNSRLAREMTMLFCEGSIFMRLGISSGFGKRAQERPWCRGWNKGLR